MHHQTPESSYKALSAEPIRWLHLSDFHVGKDEAGQRQMFKDLLKHIEDTIQEERARPDMIFITGDIADRGKASQYQMFFDEFLFELVVLLGGELTANIFLIPGNHDVDREIEVTSWRRGFIKDLPRALDPTEEGKSLREHLIERFQAYSKADMHDLTLVGREWLASQKGYYSHTTTIKGQRIGILGLNTAWLAGDDEDRHNLSPGQLIVTRGLEELKECDIRFVLGHHPIDWFLPRELEAIRSRFGQNAVIYLHGDQHRNRVSIESGSGRQFLTIESGATYQARDDKAWINRLLWCELHADEQRIRFYPRQWSTENQEWSLDVSLPERRRVKDRDYWEYPLPGATEQRRGSAARGMSPREKRGLPEGWLLIDKDYLNRYREDELKPQEISIYFDGSTPTWREALAGEIVPRRDVVRILEKAIRGIPQGGGIHIIPLSGVGGEGKSTALMQVVCDLVYSESKWNILWHENPATELPTNFLKALPRGEDPWLIVSDEADLIADDIFQAVEALHSIGRRDIHFFLCYRNTDWRGKRGDEHPWSLHATFHKIPPLEGLSLADAEQIVNAWRKYNSLGTLENLSPQAAIDEFVKQAKLEAASADGAFLGAMLRVRYGDRLKDHVLKLLNSLEERDKTIANGKLLDAFAYIVALHAENILILTREILANILGCDIGDIRRIIGQLGREATISESSDYIFTRHRAIAEVAVQILDERDKYDFDHIYVKLVESAIQTFKSNQYVPQLAVWRSLGSHFFHKGKKDLGIRLARLVVKLEPTDAFNVTQLARLYRESKQPEQAVDEFRKAFNKILKKDTLYYHEWSAAEGTAGNFAISAWLDGIALADSIPRPQRKDRYSTSDHIKLSLHGLSIAFEGLFQETGRDPIFGEAWSSAVQLGLMLRGTSETEQTHHRLRASRTKCKEEGINIEEVVPLIALERVHAGIIAAQQAEEDPDLEGIKEFLPKGEELTFTRLKSYLRVTGR